MMKLDLASLLYNAKGFLMICNVIYIIIEMIKCTHNYIGQKGFASAHALINIKRTFHYVIMIAFNLQGSMGYN